MADGISTKIIEKIQQWELIDLSKLILDESSMPKCLSVLINANPHANHGKHTISDVVSWMEAFSKYLVVLVSMEVTSRKEAVGLVAHMHQVKRLS